MLACVFIPGVHTAQVSAVGAMEEAMHFRKLVQWIREEFEEAPDDVHHEAWLRMQRERVREAIGQLSEIQRTALELAFFGGLTHVEVAERLDIPLGTVKSRINRGRARLREVLLADEEGRELLAGHGRLESGGGRD